MAYFSNGDEGDYYEARYCAKCAHQPDIGMGRGCPVLDVHLIYNYDQHKDDRVKTMLGILWPRKDGHNADCAMFVPRESIVRKVEP